MESSRDGFTWRAGFLQCAVPIDEIVHAHWCATLASDRLCSPRWLRSSCRLKAKGAL
jgi:hypothetical protein